MGKKDKRIKAGITLIASNCQMLGDIHFSDELAVSGLIKGNVIAVPGSKAKITVYENGRIEGDINVPNIVINGEVEGNIYSDKHVELAAKAKIVGNVYYNLIEMVMGSKVDGSLVHTKYSRPEGDGGLTHGASDSGAQTRKIEIAGDRAEDRANVTTIN